MSIVSELSRIADSMAALAGQPGVLGPAPGDGPSVTMDLMNTTQGPPWPPSEVVDENNDFVLIGGNVLDFTPPPLPFQTGGVIVSKDTVPPLKDGKPNFNEWWNGKYEVLRELDLSPGSKDLEMELYGTSCGPYRSADSGPGHPRVPHESLSKYNLNPCSRWIAGLRPDDYNIEKPRPLNQVTVWNLNEIPTEVPIGIPVDPTSTAPRGPQDYDFRDHRPPILLGDLMRARGQLRIMLTGHDEKAGGYTSARFDFAVNHLPPRAVHTIWALRAINFMMPPNPAWRGPDPLAIPCAFITDSQGAARVSFEVPNPLPASSSKQGFDRIAGIVLLFQSTYNSWGAAHGLYAPGVGNHTFLAALFFDLDLVTVPPAG